ncbi:MAG: cupin domain-containing protein [Clostridiales bacterium]|nr:cupin domain-containing protein [Clostridiales bacterium]
MFFSKEQMTQEAIPNVRGGPGEMIKRNWTDTLPDHVQMFSLLVLEPGSGVGYHNHDTDTEFFYILSGELEVDDNGKVMQAKPGDLVITGDGLGHSVMNTSAAQAVMLAVIVK